VVTDGFNSARMEAVIALYSIIKGGSYYQKDVQVPGAYSGVNIARKKADDAKSVERISHFACLVIFFWKLVAALKTTKAHEALLDTLIIYIQPRNNRDSSYFYESITNRLSLVNIVTVDQVPGTCIALSS